MHQRVPSTQMGQRRGDESNEQPRKQDDVNTEGWQGQERSEFRK